MIFDVVLTCLQSFFTTFLLADKFFSHLMSLLSIPFVLLQQLLFDSHSPSFVVQGLILALRESIGLIIHKELLSN